MSNEIIQSVVCDNYDGFQHVNFIFSQKFISLFWGLFNDEMDLKVRYGATKAYWLDFHKFMYISFKLPTRFQYNKKPLTFPFFKSVIYVITCACVYMLHFPFGDPQMDYGFNIYYH